MPPVRNNVLTVVIVQQIMLMHVRLLRHRYDEMFYNAMFGRPRNLWAKDWILRRPLFGFSSTLVEELAEEDPIMYERLLGVNVDMFNHLYLRVEPHIRRQDTTMRMSVQPRFENF